MPVEMRRRFFELFWEEQLERELTGQPLRLPTGDSADETFLLGIVYAAADESLHVAPIVQPDLGDAGFDRGSASV